MKVDKGNTSANYWITIVPQSGSTGGKISFSYQFTVAASSGSVSGGTVNPGGSGTTT